MERFSLHIPSELEGSFSRQSESWNHGDGKWMLDWTSVKVYNSSFENTEEKTS